MTDIELKTLWWLIGSGATFVAVLVVMFFEIRR